MSWWTKQFPRKLFKSNKQLSCEEVQFFSECSIIGSKYLHTKNTAGLSSFLRDIDYDSTNKYRSKTSSKNLRKNSICGHFVLQRNEAIFDIPHYYAFLSCDFTGIVSRFSFDYQGFTVWQVYMLYNGVWCRNDFPLSPTINLYQLYINSFGYEGMKESLLSFIASAIYQLGISSVPFSEALLNSRWLCRIKPLGSIEKG